MGKGVSKLFSTLKSKGKEQRIVMLGLDNGGKTTMYDDYYSSFQILNSSFILI